MNPKNPTNNVKNNGKNTYFNDINLGTNKKGINLFANYNLKDSINFELSAGSQESKVITSILDDSYISVSQREIETNYINLKSKIKNFSSQIAFTNGHLNYYKGSNEFQYDYGITQINLGYSFKIFELLNLKFDIDYQNTWYDDMPYLSKVKDTIFFTNGMFNGKKYLTNFGFSFRTDYYVNKRLRLIFASRVETFNYPEDLYFSNQFVSSYKINDKNLIRFVFSNSNRGPFMTDIYLNYNWKKNPYQMIHFDGNKDLKLTKTNMLEIGYRSKLRKNLFVDFEFFYTQSKNYASLMPDSVHVQMIPTETSVIFNPNYINVSYKNLDLKLKQMGISASFNAIINEKLRFKLFGTFQKTFLNNYSPFLLDSLVVQMMGDIIYNEILTTGQQTSSGKYSDFTEDYEHKSTPNIFGGLNIYFLPNENWECFLNSYFYTDQTFKHKHGTFDIKEKFIVNSKISYRIYKKNWIYFNIRNLFDNQRFEFAFLDKTRTKFLIGMKIEF